MENITTLKIELDIQAQKIIQQLQLHNKVIEDQITKGIELAMEEISKEDDFVKAVKDSTKNEIFNIVKSSIMSYTFRNKLINSIEDKIGEKVSEYTDKLLTKVMKEFK
jgi:predicted transcriptional regulator